MKMYVLGDSISIHYGPYLETYLEGVISYSRKEGDEEALLNLDNPRGANGGDSRMVLSFLEAKAACGGLDADVLLLNCGLHDIKKDPKTGLLQVPLDEYQVNLEHIVKVADAMKPQLVWIRTTPVDDERHNGPSMGFYRYSADCEAYNTVADAVMASAGVPVIDLFTFTGNLGADLFCDHVHFREHVREKQAAFLAGWVMNFAAVSSGHGSGRSCG